MLSNFMKKLFILIIGIFIISDSFSQTPKVIEADLLQSFKKIDYWSQKKGDTTVNADDKLAEANDVFGKKLEEVTKKYPSTLSAPFNLLKKEHLDIFTSDDELFRIYSWETWMGGTMRDFANVIQYSTGQKTESILLTSSEDTYVPFYSSLYTFKTGNKTYYLGVYGGIYSTKDVGSGIKVFAITNGKLDDNVKLIKTQTGLKNKIYYDYDFLSVVDIAFNARPKITFDKASQTIHIPLVNENGQVTHKYIVYKFTGQYFERVKN
jgi:hypothetical protein